MSCNCCDSHCHCNAVVVVGGLPLVLAVGATIYGLVKLIGLVSLNVSLPPVVWIRERSGDSGSASPSTGAPSPSPWVPSACW